MAIVSALLYVFYFKKMFINIIIRVAYAILVFNNYVQENVTYLLLLSKSSLYYRLGDLYEQVFQMVIVSYHTNSPYPLNNRALCYMSTSKINAVPEGLDHINFNGKTILTKMALTHHSTKLQCLPTLDQSHREYGINFCK